MQIFGIVVIILWLVVATGTVRNLIWGDLIVAPCLKELAAANAAATKERQNA
jgi:hypothetical protein